jgi:hypothetical protein
MAGQVSTYHVTVTREGRFWVGVVDGLPGGATETRALAALEGEVRDLVSGLTDTDPDSFELELDYAGALPGKASAAVVSLDQWRRQLHEAEREYAAAQRAAARSLAAARVSVRDTAQLLGVSPGRVSQLAKQGPARSATTTRNAPRKAVAARKATPVVRKAAKAQASVAGARGKRPKVNV